LTAAASGVCCSSGCRNQGHEEPVHVDLATREPRLRWLARLVELGAVEVDRRAGNGPRWVVMLDPEGNEFCAFPLAEDASA
jgi:hypothetical protein